MWFMVLMSLLIALVSERTMDRPGVIVRVVFIFVGNAITVARLTDLCTDIIMCIEACFAEDLFQISHRR